jgi:hypothetical protein
MNTGRAARQVYQWRNMFFENRISNLESPKKNLFRPRFSLSARCALERALRSALTRDREGAKNAKADAKEFMNGFLRVFLRAFAPSRSLRICSG